MDRKSMIILYSNLDKVLNAILKGQFDCIDKVELIPDVFVGQMNRPNLTKNLKIRLYLKGSENCKKNPKLTTKKIEDYTNSISSNIQKFVKYPFHKFEYNCVYVFD